METTAHMGLVLWDETKDEFDHSILADNFVKIDEHSHAGTVTHGKYVNGDRPEEAEGTEPTPTKEITNYVEGNKGVAQWTPVGLGEAIRTPEAIDPTGTAIKPETIWRYLLARRAVGHNQLDEEGVWPENLKEKAVERKHIKENAICTPQIEDGCVTSKKLHKGVLPLGIVVPWYKSAAEPSLTGSQWEVCEGQAFSSFENNLGGGESQLNVGNMPNLIDKFVRGSEPGASGSGGQSTITLTHSHTVNNHVHSLPSHNHSIAGAGFHTHEFAGGFLLRTRQNAFTNEFTLLAERQSDGHKLPNWYESLYCAAPFFVHDGEKIEPPFDEPVNMDESGYHTHGGGATGLGGGGETGAAAPGTNAQLGTYEIEPPWIGLCYIMKVRNS